MCMSWNRMLFCFFFFNDTATTEIYTLSLHDALPISAADRDLVIRNIQSQLLSLENIRMWEKNPDVYRSEEHTSELQSQSNLVCRLLLEKKKIISHNSLQSTVRLGDPARLYDQSRVRT